MKPADSSGDQGLSVSGAKIPHSATPGSIDKGSRKRQQALQFQSSMLAAIRGEPDFERAVSLSEWLARFLFSNACGCYRLDDLEEMLMVHLPTMLQISTIARKAELHIVSELYAHGGHTRLLKALLAGAPVDTAVLVTRPAPRAYVLALLGISDDRLHVADQGGPRYQIEQIASIAAGYKRVILHIHPDDIICALAMRLLQRSTADTQVALVNHSDHTFSIGIGLVDVVLEVSTFGWALRSSRGTTSKSSFIGIPLYSAPIPAGPDAPTGVLLSAGSSYKFKPQANKSFPLVLDSVLKSIPAAQLVLIGPKKSDRWWWMLKLRHHRRIDIKQRTSYEDYLRQLQSATVYLDSFPITGGTAFTEALLRGCNVAGLVGASLGYGVADGLRSRDVASFTRQIESLIDQTESSLAAQRETRTAAARLHAPAAVRARLEQSLEEQVLHSPPPEFIHDVPYRSFEEAWSQERGVMSVGFRSARQVSALPQIATNLVRAFGLRGSSLFLLFIRAAFAVMTRRAE